MVTLAAGQAEKALFEDRILSIPERDRKADPLMPVRDAADAVVVPPIGARTRVIMRKVIPRRSIRAVILTNGPPSPLT